MLRSELYWIGLGPVKRPGKGVDNLLEYKDYLLFAEDPKDWIDKIYIAIREKGIEDRNKRIEIAKNNSWDERIKFIKMTIDKKLNEKF